MFSKSLLAALAIAATPLDVPAQESAAVRAEAIIVPRLEFREATLKECAEFLEAKSRSLDPARKGVSISAASVSESERVSFSIRDVSIREAAKLLAFAAGVGLTETPDGISVGGPRAKPQARKAEAPLPQLPVVEAASTLVIPKLVFVEATLRESVDFLQQKSGSLAADRRPLNIVLSKGASSLADRRVNIDLRDVTVSSVLQDVALQCDLEVWAEGNTLLLETKAESGKLPPRAGERRKPE